ncbi:MAG: S8 family serine peptidase [Elusimicrobia bacterium]|nr:S8 family serine peptidase [Elusimicrobiota bacterium]
MRKAIAVLLSLALTGLSAGLAPYEAMASEVAPVRVSGSASGVPALPLSAVGVQLQPSGLAANPVSGLQGSLRSLPAAPKVGVPAALAQALPILPAPAAVSAVLPQVMPPALPAPAEAKTPFEQTMQRLEAPSLVQDVPAQAGSEVSADAASRDFSRRLGEKTVSAAVETAALEAPAPDAGHLASTAPEKTSAAAAPVSLPAPAYRGKQAKSPVFPAIVAAAATLVWEGLRAVAAVAGGAAVQSAGAAGVFTVLQAAASVAGFTVLGAGAVFAASALFDAGAFVYGMWNGRRVKDADFWDFVRGEVMAGRLDAGVAEMLRIHRPGRVSWNMDFGFTAGGSIHMRPELAATPWLFRQVLGHELRHLRARPQRGPPSRIRGLWRHIASEFSARFGELRAAKTIARTRIPVLERALRLAQISLSLARPYDVLVVNAGAPELENPAIYQALSAGQARVSVVKGASDPQQVLAEASNAHRFQAVVLDRASVLLPERPSADSQRLDQALEQLDELFVLATRLLPQSGAFGEDAVQSQRYQSLAAVARGLDPRDKKARERFEKLVREFWQDIAATRLKGLKVADLMTSLYGAMPNKGVAFLPFGPEDEGLPVWEKLLRFWEATDGGQFRLVRVDLENGGHILILRKVEARVGLWLRPQKGFLALTIPDADASPETREAARTALAAAGFSEQLAKFDELGVEIRHVFGADVGRQEIYVTVPRRNAGAIRRFVSNASMDVGTSQTNFEPHLFESAELHGVKPVWQAGITGADGSIMWIDTGADRTHPDFAGRLDVVDMVNEGPEDWIGHGTHVAGISISGAAPYTGMAKAARGIMAKVFSRESAGASDGEIMGAAAIGMQRGVDVINLSLGSKGSSSDNLAAFFSQLTHQKNANGEYPFVAASAGNSGPFDQTLSQPAAGEDVFATAAASVGEDDRALEMSFFSSVGPDVDKRFAVKRFRLKPDATTKGGNVTTEPGSPNVYRLGVYSAKSKDMPKNPSDTADGKHTAMSGTSMASPMLAGIALLVRLALRITGAETPFVKEHLPLVIKAVLMRTADDLRVPAWFQGAGFVNAWAAVKLAADSVGYAFKNRAAGLWARITGKPVYLSAPEPWRWVEGYKRLLDLEDKVYSAAELAKTEAKARFEDGTQGGEDEGETAADIQAVTAEAVAAEVAAKFNAARAEVLPEVLAALKDPVWLVRRQAAMVLLNLRAPESVMPLAETALDDGDPRVRQMALLALAENTSHAADIILQKAAQNAGPWDVAAYAAYALARHGDRSGVGRIVSGLSSPDKAVRFSAVWLLGQLRDKATVAEAEALSALVKNTAERGNVRHVAAAALSNVAAYQPDAVSDLVIKDLLEASGPQNLALTRTVTKFFPVALRHKPLVARLRAEPLKSAVTDFVLKNRAAVGRPGALGDLVSLLARAVNIPLDMPTPVPDPSGAGVPGVDPALGGLDVLIGLPEGRELSAYRGSDGAAEALAEAGLASDLLQRSGAAFKAGLPMSRTVWLSVPSHKFFSLSLELRHAGYSVSLSQPEHSLSRTSAQDGIPLVGALTLDLSDGVPALPAGADLSLVRVTARKAVSEARVMAVLEAVRARAADPLKTPVVVSLGLGAGGAAGQSALAGLIDRLVLDNIGVVLPAGNEGPAADSVSSLARNSLAVVVAAAGKTAGLERYSARGTAEVPVISWADLVDDLAAVLPTLQAAATSAARAILGEDPSLPADGLRPAAVGTGAAAENTAFKLAHLARRMAEVFSSHGATLPPGWFFYLTEIVRRTLTPLPGRETHETGGGVFDRPEKALELMETRLLDTMAVEIQALALARAVRARFHWTRPARTPSQAAQKAVFSAAHAVAGQMVAQPRLIAAAAELTRRVAGGDFRFQTVKPEDGVRYVQQLRAVLAAGTRGGQPFVFRRGGGSAKARSAGLEGFLYTKLELQRAGNLDLTQLDDYFRYLGDLLGDWPWTKSLRRDLDELRASALPALEKNDRLDARLAGAVREFQTELRAADAANWFRGAGIYEVSARDYGFSDADRRLFSLLDEDELRRIRDLSRADTILLKTSFDESGAAAFRRLVRRAHSLGLKVGVQWTGAGSLDEDRAAGLGVDVVRRDGNYFVGGRELGRDRRDLEEALESRDPDRVREALRHAAFGAWQRGGPAEVDAVSLGRQGRFARAAALLSLLLRPVAVNGTETAGPTGEPLRDFLRFAAARSAQYRDLVERGAVEVLDTHPGTPVVAYTISASSRGQRKTVLAAANLGDGRRSGLFRFQAARSGLGAFSPAADKTYILRDLADTDAAGRPKTYQRSGKELLGQGLYIELDSGGVHLFEIEEAP